MPELPDIDLYVEKIDERIRGQVLIDIRITKPFLVRSFDPPLSSAAGNRISELRRIGKRIVFGLEPDYFTRLIAGLLLWKSCDQCQFFRHRPLIFKKFLPHSKTHKKKQTSLSVLISLPLSGCSAPYVLFTRS